jgi:hypothetical protein
MTDALPVSRTQRDWSAIAKELDTHGAAVLSGLLRPEDCAKLAAAYPESGPFRSHIIMSRHGFGRGEYKYFAYPLPDLVATLRASLYPALAGIANRWNEALGEATRFPDEHAAFIERCHKAGQKRPTPLLLQYGEGDYNCLHQDIYGAMSFPAGRHSPVGTRPRLHRRRIRADRTASPHAVARRGGAAAPG